MMRRAFLAALPALVPLAAHAAGVQVVIDRHMFAPMAITVPAGTRVTWLNKDDTVHTVASSDGGKVFSSPPLDTGDSFAFTFTRPGVYRYYCTVHPYMLGSITVR
ncbi:MAG: cupredoxin family copper-binding protein [Rhodospirillales bacterium]|nr:cupredoxin family copper-binding protein [Rhodospirillales bacterium]MDE2575565.1 cupredoxin family copper-binding protein [Rhodospirillales bacterium]